MTAIAATMQAFFTERLIRLGWQRDPELWTVRCHDRYGRRAQVQVHLTEIGVGITLSSPETVELTRPKRAGCVSRCAMAC